MLHWAMEVLARESKNQTFGNVTFQFKNGTIVNVKVEKSEIPPASIDKKSEAT